MRKLKVTTFLTLDGVMQAPGGPEEDPSGGFAHGGWSVKYWDDRLSQEMTEFMGRPFDMVLGRKTYEIFAAYWPRSTEPGADALNNSTLINGDVGAYVANLKNESGPEIQVHGSGRLIQTLLKNDLVDEFHLMIFPIALGSGKRLFAEGTVPAAFTGVDVKTSNTGVIIATYQRAGAVKYGSFAPEESAAAEVRGR